MARQGGRRNSASRKKAALDAMDYLEEILTENISSEIAPSAAAQLSAVGQRHKIPLSPNSKRLICRECKSPLIPGKTSRVRIREGILVTTCLDCGRVSRRPTRGEA